MVASINASTVSGLVNSADTSGILQLQTASTAALTIDASQNVGIGTASPAAQVDISRSSTGGYSTLRLSNTGASGKVYEIGVGGNAASAGYANNLYVYESTSSNLCSITNRYGIGLGATVPSSGTGIAFPATQSASSDANTLDDYEEGTWTPAITFGGGSTGITYGSRVGTYRKVGSLVVAQCYIGLTNKGSSTGPSNVTGFPFTSTSVSNAYCTATTWGSNLTNTGMIESYISPSATVVQLQQLSTAGANANLTETNFANNTEVMVTVSYQTS
jgi:hypothetical protein